jgi:ketol-acid reductoisomerase
MGRAMAGIRDGTFVQEWRREQEAGYPFLKELRAQTELHPVNRAETRMHELLKSQRNDLAGFP